MSAKSTRIAPVDQGIPAAPTPVGAFVDAVNAGDLRDLLALLGPDVVVNDQLQEYVGARAAERWLVEEVIGQALSIRATEVRPQPTGATMVGEVKGDFDTAGLPQPLLLLFYFTLHDGLIQQLIIVRKGI